MLEEVVPQHFGNISHTHGGAVAGIGFCTASMLRARMALASSLRDIVHSVARLKFGSEKIFEFALVDGELTDAVRQFSTAIGS